MPYQSIASLSSKVGQEVTIGGWAYNFRSSGKIFFLQLRDGSGFVQVVYSKSELSEAEWEALAHLKMEASVVVSGLVKEDTRSPSGVEIEGRRIQVVQNPTEDYPIGKKDHGPDFLLEHRHLWVRSTQQWAVLRLRHFVKMGLQDFFNARGFVELDTPTFTSNACEGTTDLFEVAYFDEKAYLTQNGQLYLEALCMSFGNVYDLCPNFRAEKSKTRKHLTEFWTLNPEMAHVEHEESLRIQEEAIKHVFRFVLGRAERELVMLERNRDELQGVVERPFVHYEYPDAITELQKRGSAITYGDDLGAEDEILLTEHSDVPVIVKNWPKTIKPFYMKEHPKDSTRVLNADVLASHGFGEIVGGSQREDNYAVLRQSMINKGVEVAPLEWYLDLRRYGSVPHSGFGIGIERMTRWIAGIHHIRETIPFPRTITRITP